MPGNAPSQLLSWNEKNQGRDFTQSAILDWTKQGIRTRCKAMEVLNGCTSEALVSMLNYHVRAWESI